VNYVNSGNKLIYHYLSKQSEKRYSKTKPVEFTNVWHKSSNRRRRKTTWWS